MSLNLGVFKAKEIAVPNMWVVGVPCFMEKQITLLKVCDIGKYIEMKWII